MGARTPKVDHLERISQGTNDQNLNKIDQVVWPVGRIQGFDYADADADADDDADKGKTTCPPPPPEGGDIIIGFLFSSSSFFSSFWPNQCRRIRKPQKKVWP
jgi:hypothetical protein